MAEERVQALYGYLSLNEERLNSGDVTVGIFCGWARAAGERRPENPDYLEGNLMLQHAKSIGMVARFGTNVNFHVAPDADTTTREAVFARRSGIFARCPRRFYSPERRLGVIAHRGASGTPKSGHMGRCLYTTGKSFNINEDCLGEIPAAGVDTPSASASEETATKVVKICMGPMGHWQRGMLLVDDALVGASRIQSRLQKK
jgi:hypothetical protein